VPVNGDITRIAVVIPAFNESANIGECLRSVQVAATACPVEVQIIVVADSCTDDTADIARAAGARVIDVAVRTVGVARAAGCAAATDAGAAGLWLANTDADSVVPTNWLARQCRYASTGIDVVAGTVAVTDWQNWPPALRLHYDTFYADARRRGRHHIHGCNLGMSATAYRQAGGFTPLSVGEDRAFVDAARTAGLMVTYPDDIAVRTSARRHARVDGGGFHTFLTAMAAGL
jgi:glycosyltransferase involved in cell wall biosynthesis